MGLAEAAMSQHKAVRSPVRETRTRVADETRAARKSARALRCSSNAQRDRVLAESGPHTKVAVESAMRLNRCRRERRMVYRPWLPETRYFFPAAEPITRSYQSRWWYLAQPSDTSPLITEENPPRTTAVPIY